MRLIVTTSQHPTAIIEANARSVADRLSAQYMRRHSQALSVVLAATEADRLLIVTSDKLILHDRPSGTQHFYHPNLALVRVSTVRSGGRDLFLEATALQPGESLLDCTLGFATEASLAAMTVGESGSVFGLESVPELAETTRVGLSMFPMRDAELRAAMRRVQVVTADYRKYLPQCPSSAFHVVYFDPFFGERLTGAELSVGPLALFGNPAPLDADSVLEARRVASRRVVIKHPQHEPLPTAVAAHLTETITSRKSRLVYSILDIDSRK